MREQRQVAGLHGRQHGGSTRPKQLRNREVPWEGSHRSKRMSRRTERPYQVDGVGKLAPHSAALSSAPEINGPVVPREFTFLLREICARGLPATAGTGVSNGPRAGAEVSRGRSTGDHEPGAVTARENEETGRTHDPGRAELGRQTRPVRVLSRSVDADRLSFGQRSSWQRKSAASSFGSARNRRTRTRMSGGVGAGGEIPPATRLGDLFMLPVD